MSELFLQDHPSYTGRPLDAERDRLMRDWDKERQARIANRWEEVKEVGKTALAVALASAAGFGALKGIEYGIAQTAVHNKDVNGSIPALVHSQSQTNQLQDAVKAHEAGTETP
jgi:hypothetical protein